MSKPVKISAQVLDEATDWLVILHSGELTEEQYQQFEQWKAAKPEHQQAIAQVEKLTLGLSTLPSGFQPNILVNSKQTFSQIVQKGTLFGLTLLSISSLIFYCVPWHKWQSDYHTQIGEIQTYHLKDGSKLILASNSYINIDFSKDLRQIELIEGEIYIETGKDPLKRPFIVKTQYGHVEALGTQFTVCQAQNDPTKVYVYQDAVAIQTNQQKTPHTVYQGHRAAFDQQTISKPLALRNERPYWTQHLLIAENLPLKKVMHELYRYQKGRYFLAKELQNIPISGVFSLSNIEQSLETLAYTHQLELNYYSAYLLNVQKK